jgi:hypothetical protein
LPGQPGYDAIEYDHDAMSRISHAALQNGDSVRLVYDLAGRATERQYRASGLTLADPATDIDSFTYDNNSRLTSATKGRYGVQVSFGYDDAGRLANESMTILGQTYSVGRAYDSANRVQSLTYPDGSVVASQFDARSLVSTLSRNSSQLVSFNVSVRRTASCMPW